jgi:hypothetical protein
MTPLLKSLTRHECDFMDTGLRAKGWGSLRCRERVRNMARACVGDGIVGFDVFGLS